MRGARPGFLVGPLAFAAPIVGLLLLLAAWLVGAGASASIPPAGPSKPPPVGTGTPVCGVAWNIVASPNPGDGWNALNAVAAASATDIWAAGFYTTTTNDTPQSLIERWNGSAWSTVPSPAEGALYAMAAVAPNDVWAVGYAGLSPGPYTTVIEHWNGTVWSVVPSPNPGSVGGQLLGISALSANDIWVVGFYVDLNASITLTLHWDGSEWTQVTSPNAAINTELHGVAAIAPDDVWAVGAYVASLNTKAPLVRHYVPVTFHWNGIEWSVVTPDANLAGYLFSVEGTSADNVWAVGYVVNGGAFQTLALHWDGSAWSQATTPNPGLTFNFLYGISVVSASDMWAVGRGNGTLTLHWNGSAWSEVPSPNANGGGELDSVFALSGTDAWAVGTYLAESGPYQTMIEHYADPCPPFTLTPASTSTSTPTVASTSTLTRTFTRTPTLTKTPTSRASMTPLGTATYTWTPVFSSTPSVTATPTWTPTQTATWVATGTATPNNGATDTPMPTSTSNSTPASTVTPCPMNFSDVQPSDYFYEAVHYLYCAGAISGYSDGTFRPYNNTTRGQLSKIVVLSLGWQLDCPQPGHFTDVPADSPFYCYIETAYGHGIISGYSDGTFRPGNNVTRGQLCKIIVLAMAWTLVCPPPGHFTDVPLDNAFFCYVETAYAHGIISGYSDGTFRPGNNATRGQICKIVYQAIR